MAPLKGLCSLLTCVSGIEIHREENNTQVPATGKVGGTHTYPMESCAELVNS